MPIVDVRSGAPIEPKENGSVLVLENTEDPEARAEEIAGADLVVLSFPAFRDGRAYSQARAIRARLKFDGDLRASGEVLPDQIAFMRRCGFTSAEIAEEHVEAARDALAAAPPRYQAGVADGATIIERRRAARRRAA